jgi:hypothetical protein
VFSTELRSRYEAAVRDERTAWTALQNARDTDESYTALEALWAQAAMDVAKLAAAMGQAGEHGNPRGG